MGGGLRIIDTARSLIFDEQLLEPGMKFSSAQIESVYAIPLESVKVSVIITNTTAQLLSVSGSATFAGISAQHPVNGFLRPYESRIIDLPPGLLRQSGAGAVSLSHNGGKGALLAMIHVQEPNKGFSAAVNFNDPAQGKTTQLHGAGLRLGNVFGDTLKPVIAVRNLGSSAASVTARIPYAKQDGSTGTISLPSVSLAPGEIRLLDTSSPQLGEADFATAGLELEYTGAPGRVIASACSVSHSGTHVFALPLKDPQGGLSSTGGYPWFINGTASTVVFIKNTTTEPRQFHLTLSYQGGKWGSNLKTLAPGQTYLLDIRKVRDEQEKGADGNIISPDAASGHVAWSVRGGTNKVLIGRAQTVDFTNGLAATYECQCTCPNSFYGSRLLPGVITGFIGDTQQFLAQEQDVNCYNAATAWYTLSNGISFGSDNSGVATINSSGFSTATGAGATLFHATWNVDYWYLENIETGFCNSTPDTADCTASCTVECLIPTSESTVPVGWDDIAGSKHKFIQRLLPATTSFAGRRVYEQDPGGGGPDTCWFPGSERAKFEAVTNDPSQYWTVAQGTNQWGPDVIGWSPAAVTYYRAQGRAPCSTSFRQRMVINCGNTLTQYIIQDLAAAINSTTVMSYRAGQRVERTFP
ncbi:MAG: hypothetical protein U0Z53_19580 [Blastocatellia bacterium]